MQTKDDIYLVKYDVNERRALATKITIEKNSIDGGRFYLFKALAQTFRQTSSETWFVEAHTVNVVEGTGNCRFSPVTLTRSTDNSTASSFPIRWFLLVLGHCPGHRSCVSFAYFSLHRAGHAKPTIKDRPKDQSDQSGYPTDQLEI